jgi:peptidoglycan/LPS O-acetylase OafA/YrhL
VAILLVVLYHARVPGIGGGYVGVDVFFVISGFVITGILLRQSASTGRPKMLAFYGRRVLRIVPMATVVIAVTMVAERVLIGVSAAQNAASGARWATLFCANIHSSLLFGTFWSLGVEEQFYLVYPALLFAVAIVCRKWPIRAKLAVVLATVIVASFSWSALNPAAEYGSAIGRAWELAVGAMLAVATGYLKKLPASIAAVMTWTGLIGLTVIAFGLNFSSAYPGPLSALPVGAAALIIGGGTAAPRMGVESLLKLAPFKWTGRWSYSLYLWHWPIIIIALQHWRYTDTLTNLLPVGLAVALSAGTYFAIENPIRHSTFLRRSPVISIAFGGVLVAVCLVVIASVS